MGQQKISFVQLERLVRDGNGVSQAARILGVTKGAVSRALKRMNLAVARDVAIRSAPQVVEKKIDAIEQLQKINRDANELLDVLMAWNRGDEGALQILESQVRKVRVRDSEEEITQYKMADPRQLALRAMGEIREQLALQADLFKSLYSIKETERFREAVLQEIGSVAPEVREKITIRLAQQNIIMSSLSLPSVVDLEARLRKAEEMARRHEQLGPELQALVDEAVDDEGYEE